jgi:hypothetical protein
LAAPSAAVAYLAEAAYLGMRLVVQLAAAVACTPGTEGLAAGRQSCTPAGGCCEACLVPLAGPSGEQHCVVPRVNRQWTLRQHHLSRRVRER